ncbi:hypothetical protein BDV93DRAFT_232187 [Ceratobasidium sp. AG-I]|nr:hypothetical protein BDV93DRAFT_232187 [Ceratobasidium sp. AG-I]
MSSNPQTLDSIHVALPLLHMTQVALKKRHSLVSPVYGLPPELLASIFTTAVAILSPDDSSDKHARKDLSHVCSRWRQVALEVCPAWRRVTLTIELDDTLEGKLMGAKVELEYDGRKIHAPVYRSLGVDDTQYTQMILDAIAPYIK